MQKRLSSILYMTELLYMVLVCIKLVNECRNTDISIILCHICATSRYDLISVFGQCAHLLVIQQLSRLDVAYKATDLTTIK